MTSASDEELARILQAEFDEEYQEVQQVGGFTDGNSDYSANSGPPVYRDTSRGAQPLSLIDNQWELLDPTPDPRALFLQFNDKFFWGRLAGVEVKWSPRMTLCAGVCSYEGRGGLCSIRLSVPLLKLRPRKDLVETLLHEMIHAYLFVTQNNRDRDGHGPEFCKHMYRINKESGTKITIYHTFHDEVDNYRQHWWRCDGPCQKWKPYFGYVKRAMNRAPSAQDNWWARHQQTCGGTYTKVKEPEGYSNKKRKKGENENDETDSEEKKQKKNGSQDIRNFLPFSGTGHRLGGSTTNVAPGIAGPSRSHLLTGGSESKENTNSKVVTHSDKRSPSTDSDLYRPVGQSGLRNDLPSGSGKDIIIKRAGTMDKTTDSLDYEKKQKKLKDLKAIFLSSSEDEEEDERAVEKFKKHSEERKSEDGNNRPSVYLPNRTQGSDTSQTSCKKDTAFGDNVLSKTFDSNNSLDVNSKFLKTASGYNSVNKSKSLVSKISDRDSKTGLKNFSSERGGPLEDVVRRKHPSGQGSLHHLVDRMKRKSGEGEELSTDGVERFHRAEPAESSKQNVTCPVCGKEELNMNINSHLDICLSG